MRKIYLCGIFILFSSLLWGKAPFGIFEESLQKDSNSKQLWTYILNGQPITLDLVLPQSEEPKRTEWEKYVQHSFNMWFTDTAKMIEQSGRSEEFSDVLPILKRGLVFGPSGLKEQVIVYDSVKNLRQSCGNPRGLACASLARRIIEILTPEELDQTLIRENVSPEPLSLWLTIAHEFGHQLGFIGQYPEETFFHMNAVSPRSHSSTAHVHETVMSGSSHQGKIGCDDTDGIINMIDLQRNGVQGNRTGKTWKSFCKNSKDEFRDGKCVNCHSYQIRRNFEKSFQDWMWGEWNVDIGTGLEGYELGLIPLSPLEMVNIKETIVERDGENRPLKTTTNNGATVYYEYFQAVTRKAAFIKGKREKLAWVESVYQDHKTNEYVHELEFLGKRNHPITMKWSKPSSFSYKEWYGPNRPLSSTRTAEIKFACKKTSHRKLKCNVEKDELLQDRNSELGNFRDMNRQSIEYKTAKAVAVNTLLKWFEQLPDKPLQ